MNDSESRGAKPRDHEHPRHHGPRRPPHRNWWVWVAVVLMLVGIGVYVLTGDFAFLGGHRAGPPTPAANAP